MTGDRGGFRCDIRYEHGDEPALPAAEVRGLCRFARRKGEEWGTATCRFLGLDARRTVTLVLRQGTVLSFARGSEVVIGVRRGTVSAALAHELVHAVAGPSPLQAYAEGLAVWADAELRLAGPAWPFFGLRPDRWVRQFVEDGSFVPLSALLDGPATPPSPDTGFSDAARVYLEAASLVGFIVSRLGIDGFWPYFGSGRPLAAPGRATAALERAWTDSIGGAVTPAEARLRDAALARMVNGRDGLPPRPAAAVVDR